MIDKDRIEAAVREIIEAIGENPEREGLLGTPRRVADMYAELFAGMEKKPGKELSVDFEVGHREMVVVRDIPFYSMCEHHFLPFYGVVHVGYVPNKEGRVVGLSKIARTVEIVARRPQLQERMTTDIADAIFNVTRPDGVGVIIKAEHFCMIMRGIKKPGSSIITSALRGTFRSRPETRAEFSALTQDR
ncbi:GTP cyclohydrolase I FolE [Chloroflexota bacterium]